MDTDQYVPSYPENPYKEYWDDPDQAKASMAMLRLERKQWYEARKSKLNCPVCKKWQTFRQRGQTWLSPWQTGRLRYEAECSVCGHLRLTSFHPEPVRPAGLAF